MRAKWTSRPMLLTAAVVLALGSLLVAPARPTGPPHHTSRQGTGVFSVGQDVAAVHEYMDDAGRVLMRVLKGRRVTEFSRIENDDVSVASGTQIAPVADTEYVCRQT